MWSHLGRGFGHAEALHACGDAAYRRRCRERARRACAAAGSPTRSHRSPQRTRHAARTRLRRAESPARAAAEPVDRMITAAERSLLHRRHSCTGTHSAVPCRRYLPAAPAASRSGWAGAGYPTRACGRCGAVGSGSFCETAGPGRGGAGTEQSGGRNLLCGDDRDEMYPVDEAAVRTVCARACVVHVHTCRGACNSAHGALCALRVCPRVGQHLAHRAGNAQTKWECEVRAQVTAGKWECAELTNRCWHSGATAAILTERAASRCIQPAFRSTRLRPRDDR